MMRQILLLMYNRLFNIVNYRKSLFWYKRKTFWLVVNDVVIFQTWTVPLEASWSVSTHNVHMVWTFFWTIFSNSLWINNGQRLFLWNKKFFEIQSCHFLPYFGSELYADDGHAYRGILACFAVLCSVLHWFVKLGRDICLVCQNFN